MPVVRLPLALVVGLLVTLTVFTVLFRSLDGPLAPPILTTIVDHWSAPLHPTPPPPPPIRPTKVEPPKLIPTPGHGTGIGIVDPPPVVNPLPHIFQPGEVRIETERVGLTTGGVDREPIPLVRIEPNYPPQALLARAEGWVQVQFTISERGTVKDATVVASSDRHWTLTAIRKGGDEMPRRSALS